MKLKEVLASNSKIYLVLELIKGGDLFDVIKGTLLTYFMFMNIDKGGIDEDQARKFF